MQHEGKPQFIHAHRGTVKGVSFSPKERYLFCSGGTDGKVNLYNALIGQHIMSTKITSPHTMKNINAVKFNADGSRILSTTSRRLSVIDAERGELVCSYDNCAYSGNDRAPLASDPQNPYMAICSNGKGLITFDLRNKRPAHFALNVHSTLIKDIIYLDKSWPFGECHQNTVVSLSYDGVCKIRTVDDCCLQVFDVKHRANSVTATPDVYAPPESGGFESIMMIGGDCLTRYRPSTEENQRLFSYPTSERPIQRLKYISNGYLLYAIVSGGHVRRYKRVKDEHSLLGEVFSHDDEILDLDISPNDEYIVTASRDGQVGLLCLGAPSIGWSSYYELA